MGSTTKPVISFDTKYRATNKNCNADALSRLPIKSTGDVSDSLFAREVNELHNLQVEILPVISVYLALATKSDPLLS